jgi:hypothetical protein
MSRIIIWSTPLHAEGCCPTSQSLTLELMIPSLHIKPQLFVRDQRERNMTIATNVGTAECLNRPSRRQINLADKMGRSSPHVSLGQRCHVESAGQLHNELDF